MLPQTHRRYFRTREAADYIGMAKSTMEKWRLTGDGPRFSKCLRAVLYDVQDLDEWLRERRRTSTSDDGQQAGERAAQ